jgi:peptidoglycan/xylan/chitin deacetylase (PgdA/CDA1 family)
MQRENMRVLFWYCDTFGWNPAIKTLDDAPDAGGADMHEKAVVAFIHVEPGDVESNSVETKLVKNAKWVARKWDTKVIILHSFTHLGEEKAEPEHAKALLDRAQKRLDSAGYEAFQTPYGYFNDLTIQAQGHPLSRIYKAF